MMKNKDLKIVTTVSKKLTQKNSQKDFNQKKKWKWNNIKKI